MPDCFSLPNAAELVAQLRSNPNNVWMTEAADAIEQLIAKNARLQEKCDKCGEGAHSVIKELIEHNAKLKAERDAAVADIIIACRGERTLCGMCGNKNCEYAGDNQIYCYKCTHYEWRGAVKEGE